jgi:hypothetical protein
LVQKCPARFPGEAHRSPCVEQGYAIGFWIVSHYDNAAYVRSSSESDPKNSHFHGAAPSFMLNFFALLGTVAHSLLAIRPASSSLPRREADNAAHARKRQQCRDQTLGHCLQITAFPGSVAVSGHRLLHYDPAEPQKNATCAKHTDQG